MPIPFTNGAMMRLIKVTYETVTPESAADGEAADRGWVDEEGIPIAADELVIEEYGDELSAVVGQVAKEISGVEASSYRFHSGVWYTETDGDTDYRTGANTRRSYHLDGFSLAEERAIYAELTGR